MISPLQVHLRYTDDIDNAVSEIKLQGGHVTQIFTEDVFEARLADDFDLNNLKFSYSTPPNTLDSTSQIVADAWSSLQSSDRAKATEEAKSSTAPLRWDTPGFQPPGKISPEQDGTEKSAFGKSPLKSTGTPTSLYMRGSVAVGLIVVAGNTADLTFSSAEQNNVVQQVAQGLQFLTSVAPLNDLTFVYDIHFLTVTATPNPSCSSYEGCESVWRDPALLQLGYSSGYAGCVQYAEALRLQRKTDWSYVAFFTKYPQHHFAYAGGVRLCMQYSNDGWGPDQIHKVFAHETCHIFGAADEYGNCSCGSSGYFNVPNNNCVNCTTNQVSCLMDGNVLTLCYWSQGQIGWWPQVANTIGAITIDGGRPYTFVTGSEGHLWVNWWSGSAWNWSDQGTPAGISLGASMGAITVDGGRPYVFAEGSDGNLWVNWWSGSEWQWSNQGTPAGISLGASMGAITVDGGRPYVFAKGSDGNLWINWWSGSSWNWANQG